MQTEKVIEHIVNWLIDYKRKNTSIKGFVVGVSGGIDSAVVSTLCARTGAPLMALEIPILGTEPEFRRSKNHIQWLKDEYGANVQSQNINLRKIFHDFTNMLPAAPSRDLRELSQANFQARLRMIGLHASRNTIFKSIIDVNTDVRQRALVQLLIPTSREVSVVHHLDYHGTRQLNILVAAQDTAGKFRLPFEYTKPLRISTIAPEFLANHNDFVFVLHNLKCMRFKHSVFLERNFFNIENKSHLLKRAITLYHFAQVNGYIVVGTGNKVEDFGVGFFTKYGDGGVDISPIADLLKTEVRMLAAALGVSQEIIEAPSTDGLYEDSPGDEVQMGATYEEIEWAMKQKAAGKSNDSKWTKREKEVYTIVENRFKANEHKMTPIPICKIPQDLKQL